MATTLTGFDAEFVGDGEEVLDEQDAARAARAEAMATLKDGDWVVAIVTEDPALHVNTKVGDDGEAKNTLSFKFPLAFRLDEEAGWKNKDNLVSRTHFIFYGWFDTELDDDEEVADAFVGGTGEVELRGEPRPDLARFRRNLKSEVKVVNGVPAYNWGDMKGRLVKARISLEDHWDVEKAAEGQKQIRFNRFEPYLDDFSSEPVKLNVEEDTAYKPWVQAGGGTREVASSDF